MRLRIREEHRAMPAYEKPPAWRVDVYLRLKIHIIPAPVGVAFVFNVDSVR